jgi:hypothetical protein
VLADTPSRSRSLQTAALHGLLPLVIAIAGLAVFFNGSFFASYNAPTIDFSINWVAAHALGDRQDPYGQTTLYQRATDLHAPTELIYSQLFTSYIQPPTSGLSLLPLTILPFRSAAHVYLVYNHLALLAAIALSLYTIRPKLAQPWVIAGASVIVAFYSQFYMSFSLGQVDCTLMLLYAIGFWAFCRNKPAIAGSAIAVAAAIKLVPAFILLYFLWKRQYKAFAWGAGVGLSLLLVSLAYVGPSTYKTYVKQTLPALSHGSTHYSNASIGAAIARSQTPDVIHGLPYVYYLDEVPSGRAATIASTVFTLGGLVLLAIIIPRRLPSRRKPGEGETPSADAERPPERLIFEYYLVVAVTLIVSSVTWEFYVIWLLPVFLAVFLAPERVLPDGPWRWLFVAVFALIYVGFNYPGDLYIFDRNSFFYHPEWVPGEWVEDHIAHLYHRHSDAILLIRLPMLFLMAGTLSALTLWRRGVSLTVPSRE